jgi:hypothetical protein
MATSGPLQPRRPDGSVVEATFELSSIPVFDLVYRHKAGGRDGPRSVNADYMEGLELVLARLASVGASILGISVDSRVARELDPVERELDLPFPLEIDSTTNVAALRSDITRAQKPIARRAKAKPGGGNDQKTIRITIACNDQHLEYGPLVALLVHDSVPQPSIAAASGSGEMSLARYRVCPHCGYAKSRLGSNRCVQCRREFERP